MSTSLDYNTERENNIIKNIAKEIVLECIQHGYEVTQELANYLVKLKLLNPKHGFTASEVMPRSLTQQLVRLVVEDLKQDTPAMNCIRMQVYWNSINLNLAELKKDYLSLMTEKAEPFLTELLNLEREEQSKLSRLLASYIITFYNLGSLSHPLDLKETVAAIHSVFKTKDTSVYYTLSEETKIELIKKLSKKITGVRLYLKSIGKAGEGIEDAKTLSNLIEVSKEDVFKLTAKITNRVDEIRDVMLNVTTMDYFNENPTLKADVYLPVDCDASDLKYLKQILVIMLQHNLYLNDLMSKYEEIDGNANLYLKECDEVLLKLQKTIRDRDAVPAYEVYDDFTRLGELWLEIQSYFFCIESVETVVKNLIQINKKEHFSQTALEKSVNLLSKEPEEIHRKSNESTKTLVPSSIIVLKEQEDFTLEFRGFCAWTLYYADGFLVPGTAQAGVFQLNNQYYSFATKIGCELWSKNSNYYLMEIYEILRINPEMVDLLNAYKNLYDMKSLQQIKKADRKISTRAKTVQTILHPIEKYWDKDYTFSEWELKKRALTLSRLVKCVTKSAQTVDHSHYRASIGLYAAPDKNKEVQTHKDNSCIHSTMSRYLYGLRGHYEDKFKPLILTRPVEESCTKEMILEKAIPCSKPKKKLSSIFSIESCSTSNDESEKCIFFKNYLTDFKYEFKGET